jgi:hypothetical protein
MAFAAVTTVMLTRRCSEHMREGPLSLLHAEEQSFHHFVPLSCCGEYIHIAPFFLLFSDLRYPLVTGVGFDF